MAEDFYKESAHKLLREVPEDRPQPGYKGWRTILPQMRNPAEDQRGGAGPVGGRLQSGRVPHGQPLAAQRAGLAEGAGRGHQRIGGLDYGGLAGAAMEGLKFGKDGVAANFVEEVVNAAAGVLLARDRRRSFFCRTGPALPPKALRQSHPAGPALG